MKICKVKYLAAVTMLIAAVGMFSPEANAKSWIVNTNTLDDSWASEHAGREAYRTAIEECGYANVISYYDKETRTETNVCSNGIPPHNLDDIINTIFN